jgi:hypothetical protein
MKYVLDASVALAWVIPRPIAPMADVLREDYRNAIHELIAPSTFPAEIASGLTKAERQKGHQRRGSYSLPHRYPQHQPHSSGV